MYLQEFRQLVNILGERDLSFDSSSQLVTVSCDSEDDQAKITTELINLKVSPAKLHGNSVEFDLQEFPFALFWDFDNFQRRIFSRTAEELDTKFSKHFAIFDAGGSTLQGRRIYYESDRNRTYIDFEESKECCYFSNVKEYLRFLQFLKEKEHKEDNFFHFVDLFSWDTRSFSFVSATKEGKLSIPFDNHVPALSESEDLTNAFTRLYEAFDGNDKKQKLPKFIKAEVINRLAKIPKSKRLHFLIENLESMLEVAEQNFDVYLYDLSLENLKKDYLDSKDKYFAQLREILGKITTQIIALPLTTSAVALASYSIPKDGDKQNVMLILLGVFIVYSLYAVFLLKLYFEDIEDLKHQYARDFRSLEESVFFVKYPEHLEYFNQVKSRVGRKIATLNGTIIVYFILLTATNTILVGKLLSDLNYNTTFAIIFALVLVVVFLTVWIATFESQARTK